MTFQSGTPGEQSLSIAAGRPLNRVITGCPPSGIRRYFDIAATMKDAISLGVGEPDFVTPLFIREAAIEAIREGKTGYTGNSGLPALRLSICRYLKKRYGVSYNPETECLVTVGVSEALDVAMRVLLNPGDEVLVSDPCYVSYVPCAEFAGGTAVRVPAYAEEDYRFDASRAEKQITPRTQAMLIASPANPTGASQTREALQSLVALAEKHNLYIISDEIYDRLAYDQEHVCVPALAGARERTLLLNGLSKSHAMTGWRVGYACGPEPIIGLMTRVHQYTMLCANHMAQIAAIEALEHGDEAVEAMRAEYDARRRFFVEGLNRIGLECRVPQGAFYAFPSVRKFGMSSEAFADKLLMAERVATAPGSAFGPSGEGHIRCSYATSREKLEEALVRMERFVKGPDLCG